MARLDGALRPAKGNDVTLAGLPDEGMLNDRFDSRPELPLSTRARLARRNMRREAALREKHDLDAFGYDALWREQGGRCALCRRWRTLVVDHDHESGLVRQLLCSQCNTGLGMFRDQPEVLEAAAEYVRRWKAAAAE